MIAFHTSAWAAGKTDPLIDELARSTGDQVDVYYHSSTSLVRFLHVKQSNRSVQVRALSVEGIGSEQASRDFLARYGRLFGLADQSRELFVKRIKTDRGRSFVRFQQKIGDIPVFGGELIVQTDSFGKVVSVNGKTSLRVDVDTIPSVGAPVAAEKAAQLVTRHYHTDQSKLSATGPELWIYNPSLLGSGPNANRLVWRVEVKAVDLRPIDELVLVDAHSGRVALHFNQTGLAKSRVVYDNNDDSTKGLPGLGPVRIEGQEATGITDVDDAYNYAGLTYDFYHDFLGRDSLDNAGMSLISTVRYCPSPSQCPLQEVYWDTVHEQMVYGQGYASALDVVAHELTHGVTQNTSKLFNYMQSGAVSESLSDVSGKLVQLLYEPPVPPERWLIGQNLNLCGPLHMPLRDMKNPASYIDCTRYDDPDMMTSDRYYCSPLGTDGLHRNAGVNNKAAYLMTDGDTFNGYSVTALDTYPKNAIVKVAKIYYEAQTNLLTSGSDYEDLYYALQLACENLIGTPVVTSDGNSSITAADCMQVKNAVDAVEMYRQPTNCAAAEAPVCGEGLVPKELFSDNFEGGAGNWTHAAVTGLDAWVVPQTGYATSGTGGIWGQDLNVVSESYVAMKSGIMLLPNAFLRFNHAFDFEADAAIPEYYDGGILEYSANGGPWSDAGPLVLINGYNGTLAALWNPLDGRSAFVGTSYGYISSRLDLNTLAGKTVKFRFGIGTDESFGSLGWNIDDVRIYTCVEPVSITVDSNPHGLRILVDGTSYTTPHTFAWAPGSSRTINAISPQDDGAGTQYSFTSWGEGGARSKTIIVPASPSTYSANFEDSGHEQLTSAVSPADAGLVSPDCSLGCWYASGASALLTAIAGSSGYVFNHWAGDCTGTDAAISVLMNGPKTCTAIFESCGVMVKIGETPYTSIQDALDNANSGETIKVAATTLSEPSLNYNGGVSITLSGGYNCGFTSNLSAYSVLIGSLTVTSGKAAVENLIIK